MSSWVLLRWSKQDGGKIFVSHLMPSRPCTRVKSPASVYSKPFQGEILHVQLVPQGSTVQNSELPPTPHPNQGAELSSFFFFIFFWGGVFFVALASFSRPMRLCTVNAGVGRIQSMKKHMGAADNMTTQKQ